MPLPRTLPPLRQGIPCTLPGLQAFWPGSAGSLCVRKPHCQAAVLCTPRESHSLLTVLQTTGSTRTPHPQRCCWQAVGWPQPPRSCRPPALVGSPARQAAVAAGPDLHLLWPHHSRASPGPENPGRLPPTLSFDVEVRSLTMPPLQITQSHLFKEQAVPWTQTLHPCTPEAHSQSALPAPGQLHGLMTF